MGYGARTDDPTAAIRGGGRPCSGAERRHHQDESVLRKTVHRAAHAAGIVKLVGPHTLRHNADFRIMPTSSGEALREAGEPVLESA